MKVLIAVDYASSAQNVTAEGYRLSKAIDATTILLHVTFDATYYSALEHSPLMGFDGWDSNLIASTDEDIKNMAKVYLERSKQILGDENIQTLVKKGDFGETILNTASETNADIIVMGTHNQKWLEKLLVGSVTEYVIRHSGIPIYLVPVKE